MFTSTTPIENGKIEHRRKKTIQNDTNSAKLNWITLTACGGVFLMSKWQFVWFHLLFGHWFRLNMPMGVICAGFFFAKWNLLVCGAL